MRACGSFMTGLYPSLLQGFEPELRATMAAGCPTAAAVARQRRDRSATDREHWGVPVPSGGPVSELRTEQQAAPLSMGEGKPAARGSDLKKAKQRPAERGRLKQRKRMHEPSRGADSVLWAEQQAAPVAVGKGKPAARKSCFRPS